MRRDVPSRVGNQVTTQTILTTIDSNETLEVYVNVPIERASELKRGLPVQILSSEGDETLASTAINFVSPHVDDQTQSVLGKGAVQNRDGRLRASQYVPGRLIWQRREGLVVPVTAVLRINGQYFAFVGEDAGGKLRAKQAGLKAGPNCG